MKKKNQRLLKIAIKTETTLFLLFLFFVLLFFISGTSDYYINSEVQYSTLYNAVVVIAKFLQPIAFIIAFIFPFIWVAQVIFLFITEMQVALRLARIIIPAFLYSLFLVSYIKYEHILFTVTKYERLIADKNCNEKVEYNKEIFISFSNYEKSLKDFKITYLDSLNNPKKENKIQLRYDSLSHLYIVSFFIDSSFKNSDRIICTIGIKTYAIRNLKFSAWAPSRLFKKIDLCFCSLEGAIINSQWEIYDKKDGFLLSK